jgi:steroid delta-isomerase-like uncharacterized protein
MSRIQANLETVRRFYALFSTDAFRAGRFDALREVLSPDFVDQNPVPGQGPGIDGLAHAFAGFYAAFADFGVSIEDIVGSEDTVAVRLTFRGTHTGPFLGAAATGRRFEVSGMNFIRIGDDGRPKARWGLADWQGIVTQLGLDQDPRAQNLERVQATYAAFGRGDLDGILSGMHDDVVWESNYPAVVPFGGTYRGANGVRSFVGRVGESVEVLAFAPEKFVADGSRVIAVGREKVRVRGTGREYENAWVHVFELQGGRIATLTTFNDTGAVASAFSDA